jgi:hypothetical protein
VNSQKTRKHGSRRRNTDPHAVSLAVLTSHGEASERGILELSRAEFHGTAFALAPNLFLTAWHVYNDARAAPGKVALARLTTSQSVHFVADAEEFPAIDVAILHCPGLTADIRPFNFATMSWLDDVAAYGFAFGLTLSSGIGPPIYVLRAFKGSVVTRRGLTELQGVPPGYEVSFVPPPGLSGAPLLSLRGDRPVVKGIMLQHHTAELAGRRMDLGLALDIEELLTLDSRLVGGSVAECVFNRERVPPRNGSP